MDRIKQNMGRVAELLAKAGHITVLTGAGVSAESGIPTFRDRQGLWASVNIEDVATPDGFKRDPARVWRWYSERRKQALGCRPNGSHLALAHMERELSAEIRVITQNVDGLHRRAGSSRVTEVHGALFTTRCSRCEYGVDGDEATYESPPLCPECRSLMRPGVVWFGEMLPMQALEDSGAAMEQCDVLLVIGASAAVQPVASMPLYAKAHGACLIEINPNPTPVTPHCDYAFAAPSGECLPELFARARQHARV